MGETSLDELVERLRSASEDLKSEFRDSFTGLLFFGSHVRGEARKDSDVDLLVVLKGLKGMEVRSKIYNIIADHVRKPLTLIDVDMKDITSEELVITPLLMNALYDGIIIYDESKILAKLKSKVRELIRKAGLIRYRTPDGKYGWKRRDEKPLEAVEV